jgi:hypothetical protein
MTTPAIQVSVKNMDPTRTLFIASQEDPHAASTVREIAPGAEALLPLRDSGPIRLGTAPFEAEAPAGAGRVEAAPVLNRQPASTDRVPGPPERVVR